MPGFSLTNKAQADSKAIGRYTENTWGREQRNRYLTLLDSSFHDLAGDPLKGRDCSYIRDSYHKYGVGRHIVFYRQITADRIEIVRILHDHMEWNAIYPNHSPASAKANTPVTIECRSVESENRVQPIFSSRQGTTLPSAALAVSAQLDDGSRDRNTARA